MFQGPFIVHLEETHKHEEFENNVKVQQSNQYPFDSRAVKVLLELMIQKRLEVCSTNSGTVLLFLYVG